MKEIFVDRQVAEADFLSLVDEVEAGAVVFILRGGRPVVKMIKVEEKPDTA